MCGGGGLEASLSRWSSGSLCLGGANILASVLENSPPGEFISNLTIRGDPAGGGPGGGGPGEQDPAGGGPGGRSPGGGGGPEKGGPGGRRVRLCLAGRDADWFYLEGRTLRLKTSTSRVLDREVGAVMEGLRGRRGGSHLVDLCDLCVLQVHGPVLLAKLICYEDGVMRVRWVGSRAGRGSEGWTRPDQD